MLWLVPGLALTKSKINSGELTDKYHDKRENHLKCLIQQLFIKAETIQIFLRQESIKDYQKSVSGCRLE